MKAIKIGLEVFVTIIVASFMYVSAEIAILLAGQVIKLSAAGRAEIAFAVIFTEIFTVILPIAMCLIIIRYNQKSLQKTTL